MSGIITKRMYGRKSKYQRKYARRGRKSVAKLAKGKTTSIMALARTVRSLQRAQKSQHQYQNYVVSASQTNVNANYLALNLCNYNTMFPIFGADADDDNNQKMTHMSIGMDFYLSLENLINNEEDTITFTMFLVSLKDHIGSAFDPATGSLTLVNGNHYYQQNGLAMLNKKAFNIHKVMRRTLTNHGTTLANPSAQTQYGTDCRWYWKISPRSVITNPVGDWKVLQSALDPSKQYYVLIFNDNSILDAESPALSYNFVHTVKTIV